jgi:hypothetical protein
MMPCRSGNRGAKGTIFRPPLASRNPNTGNSSKPIGFHNRFDVLLDKRKNKRGFEHDNDFQEVNQQNTSTRIFHLLGLLLLWHCYFDKSESGGREKRMGRMRWLPGAAQREVMQFTTSRCISWLEKGNWALGADYVIRALNTSSRDVAALSIGEVVGTKLSLPDLSERCSAQLQRIAARRRSTVDKMLEEMPDGHRILDIRARSHMGGAENEAESITVMEKTPLETLKQRLVSCLCSTGAGITAEAFQEDSTFGRGLRAVMRLSKGTVVLEDRAILATRMNDRSCSHCLNPLPRVGDGAGFSCEAGCSEAFCSEQCRDVALEQYHAVSCPVLNPSFGDWQQRLETQLSNSGPDSRAALTCLAIGKVCAIATVAEAHPLHLEKIDVLRGSTEYVASDTLHHVGSLTVSLGHALRQPNLFLEEFISLYALIQTNEFLTSDGTVLFPFLSLVNHSCVPNCVVVGPSAVKKSLVAVKDIREGEQLTIDYNSALTSTLAYEDRRALLAQRGFQCFCPRCILKQ